MQSIMIKSVYVVTLMLLITASASTQSRFSKGEFSINGFRNPSIGLEYRFHAISVHGGYYITALESGVTTKFIKAGITSWFLPVGKAENPSSFYAGASYLRGINLDYEDQNAFGLETGFRWMVFKGLNLRIGAIALFSKDHKVEINPTPGISYSFFIR